MKIKNSQRGLTFSFQDTTGNFQPGCHYIYDIKRNEIVIQPSDTGLKMSRKKSGHNIKSLVDLRSVAVRSAISIADYLDIEFVENKIIVHICKNEQVMMIQHNSNIISLEEYCAKKEIATYSISSSTLAKAVGGYEQLSIFDYIDNPNVSISNIMKKQTGQVIDTISLFSGAGMLDYPFAKDPAFRIRYACDYDRSATLSYETNIGLKPFCGDVRNVSQLGKTDLVIGGPSCKAFSNANRHTRMLDHPDYFLVKEYIRIVNETDPDMFVIENVPEMISAKEGQLLHAIKESLSQYHITVNIVKDDEIGGYTLRKRVFLIGSKMGQVKLPELKIEPKKSVREALQNVSDTWFNYHDVTKSKAETVERMKYVRNGHNWEDIPVELRTKSVHSSYMRRLDPNGSSPTITNFRKTCLMPPVESNNPNRIISVAEASALQGFGKEFKFLGSLNDRQQQVGNGVTLAMASLVKNTIKRAFLKENSLSLA